MVIYILNKIQDLRLQMCHRREVRSLDNVET